MTTRTPPPHEERPDWGPEEPRLSSRQQELREELAALDPVLAGLYVQGLQLLAEVDSLGVPHLLSHVGRELTLGVVDAVLDEGWSLTERDLAEIPEDETHREKIARSLDLRPSDPRVSQWFELHRAFSRSVHHRRGDPSPDTDELRLSFERLEHVLYGRVGPYFGTQAELDELLAVSEPEETHVARLQGLLLRPQQRRYFFGKLTHPGWLEALDLVRIFANPPERLVHPDGSWQAVAWPEGQFLARVAPDEPDLVAEVLERLPPSIENPGVWRVVAEVANHIPPDLGRRLAPTLAEAAGNVLPVIFADGLLSLIPRLANAGHTEAFDLASSLLLVPRAEDVGEISPYSLRSDWVFPRLRSTDFSEFAEKALPSLERTDPERTLGLLLNKLAHISVVGQKLGLTRLLDARSRSRFRPDPHDVAGEMMEAAAGVLTRFAGKGPEHAHRALRLLEEHDDAVFTRLRYRLIAAAGEHLQEQLDAVIASTVAADPGDLGREIALILREQYANASEGVREIFRYAIERGPDPESVRNVLHWREVESPTTDDIDDIKREWQRRRLTWFRGEIPGELRELAQKLDVWGEKPSIRDQELAEVGSYSESAVAYGEPTPFTADELGERSGEEIARLISDWRPDERSFETGTARGFQLSLQELAAREPVKALDVWEAAGGRLPFGFARSVLDGLRDALRAGAEGFAWDTALSIVRDAITLSARATEAATPMRQGVLSSATDLLQEGVAKDFIPVELEDEVWDALASAVGSPLACDEEEEAFESFDAVLTGTLNRAGSRAVQATLQAGLWSYRLRQREDADEASRIAEERLAPILDGALQRTGIGRVTAEAMIGQFLPQLQLMAPEWLRNHLNALLEGGATQPFEHPAWGAYVARSRLYDSTFKMLRPWYQGAAEAAATTAGRKTSEERHWSLTGKLAQHVMIAVLRGLAAVGDPDRLVETTFANVPVEERGRAYWLVFRDWSDAETPPPESLVARLLAFWEWRLDQLEAVEDGEDVPEEAQGLGWFLRTPYLPDETVLRLGLRTARAAKGQLKMHTEWDRLRDLAATDVDAVFEIAELVLEAQLADAHHFVPVDEVKPLLRVVLDRGNAQTQARARRIVNRSGEAGYDDFRDLVE